MSQPSTRRPVDPFRVLALASIVIGLLLVIGSATVWFFTDRESTAIMSMGVALAGAGGLREVGERIVNRIPTYYAPDPETPQDTTPPPAPPPPTIEGRK